MPSVDGLCPISGQFTDLGSCHQVFVIGSGGFPCCKQAGFLLFCKMKGHHRARCLAAADTPLEFAAVAYVVARRGAVFFGIKFPVDQIGQNVLHLDFVFPCLFAGVYTFHKARVQQILGVAFADVADAIELILGNCCRETVVLLSKGEIDSKKVRVEFSLEDMDMYGFQKGATYEQIKAYVLEHTGLKVSSLYISQIKRKCGLDVGQNYNLPKKEDAKVPKCPPEKEAAITEALKYFGMI